MAELDADDAAALAALLGAIRDPARVLATWRDQDLFVNHGEDGLRITLGSPSQDVATVEARYHSATGLFFPPLLRAFLEVHDGLEIEATDDATATVVVDPDPDCTNGLLAARHIETSETSDGENSGLVVGRAYHQYPLLWIEDGERAGTVMYDDGDGPPRGVAPTIAAFFHQLVAHGLSLEAAIEALPE